YFVGIVPRADDGVRADFSGMPDHDFERFSARLFAKLREERDIAADQCLETRADRAEDRARANCDSAHNAKIAHNAKSRQLKCRRDHVMRHRVTWRRDGIRRLSIDLVIHLLSFKWGAPQRTKIHPPKLFAWAFRDAPAIHSPLKVNSVSHRSASF